MVSEKRCQSCTKFDLQKGIFGNTCPLYKFNGKIVNHGNLIFVMSIIKYTGCTFHNFILDKGVSP